MLKEKGNEKVISCIKGEENIDEAVKRDMELNCTERDKVNKRSIVLQIT